MDFRLTLIGATGQPSREPVGSLNMLGSPVEATPDVLDIGQFLIDAMRAHAAEAHPREACGVLVGPAQECRFERLVRMANVGDGNDRYAFDPEAQLALWLALEAAGERPWGVYHSHPTTRARPSKVDVATAQPDMLYVIVGFDREVRAFRIVNGQVVEDHGRSHVRLSTL